jgi:hypothetical protein
MEPGMYVDSGYELRQNSAMVDTVRPTPSSNSVSENPSRYMLWIDGVGAYLLCLGERITFGGPHRDGTLADVALLANLSSRHATVVRTREGYLIEAHSRVRVANREVNERESLNDGYEIELGRGVRLRFRLPTVLSMSAAIDFLSDHRPSQTVDGVILMDETCLLGPGAENHIRCRDWAVPVLLHKRDGRLHCKSRSEVFVDGRLANEGTPLHHGQIISGSDFSFRLEALRGPEVSRHN